MKISAGLALAVLLLAPGAGAQAQAADSRPAEPKPGPDVYQTLYLTNTQQNDALDIQTCLRNMLPKSRVFYVQSQGAISLHGSADDIQLAQKILSEIDRPRKTYRITFTLTDIDGGKRGAAQHLAFTAALGQKTTLKQGSRVPIVTGASEGEHAAQGSQVQYVDVGLSIEATLDGNGEGLRLRTKVEQSSVAGEKPVGGAEDPVIRQSVLEGTSMLAQGKALLLGSFDLPESTRKQEVEVGVELVR